MLSPAQIEARRGRLTGSRVAALMTGDAAKIMQLYNEMTDQAEPENLSHIWAVRLGEATEQVNLDWYEEKNQSPVIRRGEVVQHFFLTWAACTLDGFDDTLNCAVEAKHVGGREPFEVIQDRYAPQLQWIMECTATEQIALSVIMGASEPVVEYIPRDDDYIAEMIRRGWQFMKHVHDRTPPVVLHAVPPPADATKIYDMTGKNEWASCARDWIDTKPFADKCKDMEKILKAMVPADAKKCDGHGVQITRDRAGRLSLRENQQAIFERTGALI